MIPRLHVVTKDSTLQRPDFLRQAQRVFEVGGPRVALHVRGPDSPARRLHDVCAALRESADERESLLLVNDRIDVALALDLDGVQLGERSLLPEEARALLGGRPRGVVVGRSVHSRREAREMEKMGVDFLLLGTIFPTPSHPGKPGRGTMGVREVTGGVSTPVVAIGGIGPGHVEGVVAAGAWGVAVVRAVWNVPDPGEGVQELLDALARAHQQDEEVRKRS